MSEPLPETPSSQQSAEPRRSRTQRWRELAERRRRQVRLLGFTSVVLIAAFWYWSSGRERTNNAQINGPIHPVATRVSGAVVDIPVEENQQVHQGDLLLQLDRREFEVAVVRAEADLAAAQARSRAVASGVPLTDSSGRSRLQGALAAHANAVVEIDVAQQRQRAAEADLVAANAEHESAQAQADRAGSDLHRIEPLAAKQQVSDQELEAARSNARAADSRQRASAAAANSAIERLASARSRLEQATAAANAARAALEDARQAPVRLGVSEAEAEVAVAAVAQASAALQKARLDLEFTTLRAPSDGVVGSKRVELGQVVRAGQPLLTIVENRGLWIEANFKETQIRRMEPGQRVAIRIDAFGRRTYHGRVQSLGPATGSRFSLLPPDNATGNFVKVVQRVPVRISIEEPDHRASDDPVLRPGLSAVVTVSLRSGEKRAPTAPTQPEPKSP